MVPRINTWRKTMKKSHIVALLLPFLLISCATLPPDRYNAQKGAVIGAGTGALIGQAIGGNTEGTLIGLAAGTILGALVGNAMDQEYEAAREAARQNRPVIYYDRSGRAVEAIPEGAYEQNCQRIRKRTWENGALIKETVEEVCGPPPPVVRYYPAPPPPPDYYYGWGGWYAPRFSFHLGRSYYHKHHRHRHRHHRWHHW
jgi:hypothetical protein